MSRRLLAVEFELGDAHAAQILAEIADVAVALPDDDLLVADLEAQDGVAIHIQGFRIHVAKLRLPGGAMIEPVAMGLGEVLGVNLLCDRLAGPGLDRRAAV
jgi:hypothetical protein